MINIGNNTDEIKQVQQKLQDYFQTHWKLFLVEGILLIFLGSAAIILPHFFTVAIIVTLGWILIFGGSFLIARALFFFRMPGFGLWLFMGILQIVIGYLFLAQPLEGILTLTVLITLFFALEGIAKISFALMMRPMAHWGFVFFSGVTALVLALIVWMGWPGTATWLLGLLFGVNMFFGGWSMVNISLKYKETRQPE
ncbi:MAG: HdeD family acid-resistance protein [Methylococcales bacterium]|nr:HdeD family acid-resistance protein [Methylococcales bacterium]